MSRKRKTFHVVGALVVMLLLTLLLYPLLHPSPPVPGWAEESSVFIKQVGSAMAEYALDHNNKLPLKLDELYPRYVQDERITKPAALFDGMPMAISYYCPKCLGNPHAVVAEIRLEPSLNANYHARGWVLWGDLKVRAGE